MHYFRRYPLQFDNCRTDCFLVVMLDCKSKIIRRQQRSTKEFSMKGSSILPLHVNRNICLKFHAVCSIIMLVDYPQTLTNVDFWGQGNLNLVREKSGKCQGILLSIICGNPVLALGTMQCCRWGSNLPPLSLQSSTLPLSHCAPQGFNVSENPCYCVREQQRRKPACTSSQSD